MKRTTLYLFLLASLIFTTYSCNVYDDLSSCPQDLCIRFYNQTPCEFGDPINPARLSNLKHATIALYDIESGKLVMKKSGATLKTNSTGTYYVWSDIDCVGKYKMVCWCTEDKNAFETKNFLYDFKSSESIWGLQSNFDVENNKIPELYYGGKEIEIKDHSKDGSVTDTIPVNVQEYNYRINLKVEGLHTNPLYTYKAEIKTYNKAYNFDGISLNDEMVSTKDLIDSDDVHQNGSVRTAIFNTLLMNDFVKHPSLVITEYLDGKTETVATFKDLISIINLPYMERGEKFNFDCEHNINITLSLKSKLGPEKTYATVAVTINGWNVVLRDVNLY